MPSILLCSVGHSSMIVPEAFLSRPGGFDEVHVFTTDSPKVNLALLEDFFSKRPEIKFTVTRTAGISDILSEKDHVVFQEHLWRWYLDHCEKDQLPHVCLSGGIKSMSACLQKAASLFGAQSVFHILADKNPQSIPEMEEAISKSEIHIIEMGSETGWEALRLIKGRLKTETSEVLTSPVRPVLTNMINDILGDVSRRASGFSQAYKMPFPSLALLPPVAHNWLQMPLEESDLDWIRRLPKIDLHCHLGGFATHGSSLKEVRSAAIDPGLLISIKETERPAGWPFPNETITLDTYMRLGDSTGSILLKDRGCLIRQVELIYETLCKDKVAYAEIRCSPNNYADPSKGRSAWDVLDDISSTFGRLFLESIHENKFGCSINLLVIASRKQAGDLSDINRHLSLAVTAMQQQNNLCKVVGVDLAGFENPQTRASYFEHDFRAVNRCGLAVTAHAGENDDPEGIWQAVYSIHARRLGHALNLAEAPDLMRTVIERKIGVEMCPYANFQVKGFFPMPGKSNIYPLQKYLDAGALVTVNTDNIGISDALLSDNFLLLARLNPGLTRLEVLSLIRNSIEAAFISHEFRSELFEYFNEEIYRHCLDNPGK